MPTLVMRGDDDQIVPVAESAAAFRKAPQEEHAEGYPKFPHGVCMTQAEVIKADLLRFVGF